MDTDERGIWGAGMFKLPEIYFEVLRLLEKWRRKQDFYEWCEKRGQSGVGWIICEIVFNCQFWTWIIICLAGWILIYFVGRK